MNKPLLLLLACTAVALSVTAMAMSVEQMKVEEVVDMEEQWTRWKKQFGKTYSPDEEAHRRAIFFRKLQEIKEHNSKYPVHVTYTKGLNQFSDLTVEEYREYNKLRRTAAGSNDDGGAAGPGGTTFVPPRGGSSLPKEVDWRDKGAVTGVKNQHFCGSCWAFSTTGSVEGQHFLHTGSLLSLSEQQLIDCSTENFGCHGGLMSWAFQYIMHQYRGLETEASYPYRGYEHLHCRQEPWLEMAPISGYANIKRGSEDDLQAAVATVGPVSVAIDASNPSFQDYSGGIYVEPDCSTTQLDHGVLVVGYGSAWYQDYWLVKNSWGTDWGIGGYIKMARNHKNMCGIASLASYPTIKNGTERGYA